MRGEGEREGQQLLDFSPCLNVPTTTVLLYAGKEFHTQLGDSNYNFRCSPSVLYRK